MNANGANKVRARIIYFFGALEGMVFGYDIGVVAGAMLFVKKDMALTPDMEGVIVSALLFGSLVSAPITGLVRDRVGARRLLIVSGLLFLVGSVGAALSPDPMILIIFRFVMGIGVGMGTVLVPVYLAELSPASTRGRIATLYQLLIAIGIFIAYVSGYFFSLSADWRMMFGIAAAPALVLTVGAFLLPESPRWLVKRGRVEDARKILEHTHGAQEAESEIKDILNVSKETALSLRQLIAEPWLRRLLLIAVALAALQQALGINTIVYYSPTILQAAGLGASNAILTGGTLQALSILATVILGLIVDRVGRRIPLIAGALLMAVSMTVLGVIFDFSVLHTNAGSATAIFGLALFKVTFSLSWGPVLWIVLPEILPLKARSAGMGACAFAMYVVNFVVALAFPGLLAAGPSATFGMFAIVGVGSAVLVYKALPNTSRKTLESIELTAKNTAV